MNKKAKGGLIGRANCGRKAVVSESQSLKMTSNGKIFDFLEKRILNLARDWPVEMRKDFRNYIRRWPGPRRKSRHSSQPSSFGPYWLLIPRWLSLDINGRKNKKPISNGLLKEILCGQYYLFLAVRIQDDLYDGHIRSNSLIYVADQFIWGAEKIFRKHFDGESSFWHYYYGLLKETTDAIVKVAEIQKAKQADPDLLLDGYAGVAALFKIGLIAVCLKAGCRGRLAPLMKASDNLAIAGQIADDMLDIDDDLKRGQINYAVQVILHHRRSISAHRADLSGMVREGIYYADFINRLLSEIETYLEMAQKSLASIKQPAVEKYFHASFEAIAHALRKFHAERMKVIFGKLTGR
mgnify:CR=1 FL=1